MASNNRLKVLTFVGTRPEVIRLSLIIKKIDQFCEHYLIHTGQNYDYELNKIFFKNLNLREPDEYLQTAGETPAETIGNVIIKADSVIRKLKPDCVLLLGDTNSCMAAISAKRNKVPVFHMEAGNRCYDMRVPEEINRKIVDHISDINLCYSTIARNYLIGEGIPPDQVIKVGSPMKEVLEFYREEIESSDILEALKIEKKKYFLVSAHREENVDDESSLRELIEILKSIHLKYLFPIIFSTHPRTLKYIKKYNIKIPKYISMLKPFSFTDYIALQINSFCVFSDSGTITEESSILNFCALNIREVNERPEGFEEGSVMMVGLNKERILQALDLISQDKNMANRQLKMVNDYNVDNVSEKVLRILISYIDYINSKVWRKH